MANIWGPIAAQRHSCLHSQRDVHGLVQTTLSWSDDHKCYFPKESLDTLQRMEM